MAAPANVGTYFFGFAAGAGANREDLLDVITNIDPWDTPFVSQAPKVKANHVFHEWLKDTLPATSTAGAVEGDEYSFATYGSTTTLTRVNNVCQIFRRDVAATETQRVVNPAGFKDAYAYEVAKATKAIARNIEATVFAAITSATGSSAAGRAMRTLQHIGANSFFVTASTASEPGINVRSIGTPPSTNAALTEFDFNELLEVVYTNGGNPEMCFVSPAVKRVISGFQTRAGFSSNAEFGMNVMNMNAEAKKVVASVDIYDSDYGLIQIILDRWVPQAPDGATAASIANYVGVAFFLERAKNRLAWLRPVQHTIIGKGGDNVRGIVVGEVTLEVLNEQANGYIRGIRNPSA